MDDYLSEKEQWEWLKRQIKESAPWVIAAVAAGVLCSVSRATVTGAPSAAGVAAGIGAGEAGAGTNGAEARPLAESVEAKAV